MRIEHERDQEEKKNEKTGGESNIYGKDKDAAVGGWQHRPGGQAACSGGFSRKISGLAAGGDWNRQEEGEVGCGRRGYGGWAGLGLACRDPRARGVQAQAL